MESTTPAAPSVAYREPARKRPSSRWTTVVAAAAIAGVVITAILLVLLLPRTPLSLCHGCPPGLLVGGNSLTSPGSPGCVDHPSEICYSFPVYTAYGPVSLSGLTFCLRESYTNSSIVQVGAGGTVGVIDASHGSVAVWSVAWGTWVTGSDASVATGMAFVFDSGLTTGNLTGNVFWFLEGPAAGGIGAELN